MLDIVVEFCFEKLVLKDLILHGGFGEIGVAMPICTITRSIVWKYEMRRITISMGYLCQRPGTKIWGINFLLKKHTHSEHDDTSKSAFAILETQEYVLGAIH